MDAPPANFRAGGGGTTAPTPSPQEALQIEDACLNNFYTQSLAVLCYGGLHEDQVEAGQRPGCLAMARATLDEIKAGDFGTVMLERLVENRYFLSRPGQ